MAKFIVWLGWYGVIVVVASYALLTLDIIDAKNIWYHLFNLSASIGIAAISIKCEAWQPAVLNICYMFIALYAIYGLAF